MYTVYRVYRVYRVYICIQMYADVYYIQYIHFE